MTASVTSRLAEAAARLREVEQALSGPGPLAPALAHARRPEVWVGTFAEAFAGELGIKDMYLKHRLAPGLETVAAWMQGRATDMENHERAIVNGLATLAPPSPGRLGIEGPGFVGFYEPYQGLVRGFAGLDPSGVRELCARLHHAIGELEDHRRQVGTVIEELAPSLPPDAAEAAGVREFGQLIEWLRGAAGDLSTRAQRLEVSQAVGALLGAPVLALDELIRRRAAVSTGPPPEATGSPLEQGRAGRLRYAELEGRWAAGGETVAEEMMAIQDRLATDAEYRAGYEEEPRRQLDAGRLAGTELGCLPGAGLKGDDRREARRILDHACGRNDVDFAAGFVNGLGPEHLGDLLDDRLPGSLGCVLGAASRSPHLEFDAKQLLLDHDDWDEVADILEKGDFAPQWSIDVAGVVLLERDGSREHLERYVRSLELLGRDQATAFAAATDPRIGERVTDMVGGTPGLLGDAELYARIAAAGETVLRLGLLPPPTAEPALTEARNAMERVMRGPRTEVSGRLVVDFLVVNISDVAELAEQGDDRLGAGQLSLTFDELKELLKYIAYDAESRRKVLAAAAAQLTSVAKSSAALINDRIGDQASLEEIKHVAESTGSQLKPDLRSVGFLYGMIAEANLKALGDRKAAAREIAEMVGFVSKALLGQLRMPDDVSGQLLDPMTKSLEDRLVDKAVGEAGDLKAVIDDTLTTVTALSLYNYKDEAGHYPIRLRMRELGMKPAPWGDPAGDLLLPEPFDDRCRGELAAWLRPVGYNPIYEVADSWVQVPGGVASTFNDAVGKFLYSQEAAS